MGVNLGGRINGIVTILPRIQAARRRRPYRQYRFHVGTDAASWRDHLRHLQGCRGAHDRMHARRTRAAGHHLLGLLPRRRAIEHCRGRPRRARPSWLKPATPRPTSAVSRAATSSICSWTKEQVGERVLQGILNDELYILTHSEFRQGVDDRAQAMCAAVPDLPENDEYKRTFSCAVSQPHPRRGNRAPQRIQVMKDFAGRTAFVTGAPTASVSDWCARCLPRLQGCASPTSARTPSTRRCSRSTIRWSWACSSMCQLARGHDARLPMRWRRSSGR